MLVCGLSIKGMAWSGDRPGSRPGESWRVGRGRCRRSCLRGSFDDPTIDDDLRETLAAHDVVLGDEWADGRLRLGVVCAIGGDEVP